MGDIRIHVLHTGSVCVAPALAFGGLHTTVVMASGIFERKEDRIWLPVSVYYIESPHGRILLDTGWSREMSPDGVFDKKAQIRSLGNVPLYETNQGIVPEGMAINEQLEAVGVKPFDLDLVLLSHLDCDHANGLKQVQDASRILVSESELQYAARKSPVGRIRYNSEWWDGTKLEGFTWNSTKDPSANPTMCLATAVS